jgi:hypothetical protein
MFTMRLAQRNGYSQVRRYKTWQVGQPSPLESGDIELIEEIKVDGREFDALWDTFRNLPYAPLRVNRYYGDMAKMIVGTMFPEEQP